MPYFDWGQIILNSKGSKKDMVLEDLAGKIIAVPSGGYAQELVSALQKKHPNTQIKGYESLEAVWKAVEERQADAAVVEYPMTAYYLTNHKESNLQMAGQVFSAEPLGIAVQKSNQELLEKLNRGLETIIENGTYDRICEKWFDSAN